KKAVTRQSSKTQPIPCLALVELSRLFIPHMAVIILVSLCPPLLCLLLVISTIKLPCQLRTAGSCTWLEWFLHLCHVQSIQGPAPPLPNRALFIAHYDLNKEAARMDGITKRWLWICRLAFGFHVGLPPR